jgi:hypothetical protein
MWPLSREMVTEILFIEDVGVLIFIGMYLLNEYREKGMAGVRLRLASKFATGFGIYILGHTVVRAWVIAMYLIHERVSPTVDLEDVFPIGLTGLIIAAIGMSFATRVIGPYKCRHWGWIVILAAAFLFVAIMRYL